MRDQFTLQDGFSSAAGTLAATAWQLGNGRDDTRQILGARWEHNFDINTIWRSQVVLDDKNISQPTGATTARGDEPSINVITDVMNHGDFFGFDAVHFAGIYFNRDSVTNYSTNTVPGGNGTNGPVTQITPSVTTDAGIHGREEIKFTDTLSGVAGLAWEYTKLAGSADIFNFSAAGIPSLSPSSASANNNYYNIAPEGALVFHPEPDWVIKARVATGYGTPQVSNLFVTPSGQPGANTQLKSQTNLGFDLSTTWTPVDTVRLTVDGFYEFFRNELVSQSPGPSPLMTFTFNAPRSEHRGVEVLGEWLFYPGWKARVAYTYDNQIYTDYTEQLSAGTFTQKFDRARHFIPGVPQNLVTARIGYDVPVGPAKGLGAYVEYYLTDAFYADNANLLKIPGYNIFNVNLHCDTDVENSFFRKASAYFEVRNIFNNTYVASANNVSDSLNAKTGAENPGYILAAGNGATSGTIYAGFPRTLVGSLRLRF
jgi:iron complex outermembrane receptor protein